MSVRSRSVRPLLCAAVLLPLAACRTASTSAVKDDVVTPTGGQSTAVAGVPSLPGCTDNVTSQLKAHIADQATNGWAAQNAQKGWNMIGCSGPSTPLGCFADETKWPTSQWASPPQEAGGLNSKVKILRVIQNPLTTYWMRSSPDGRFVGNGATGPVGTTQFQGRIDDLATDGRTIPVNSMYDPGFFADGSGFTFHGQAAVFCSIQMLQAQDSVDPFTSPNFCLIDNTVDVYHSIGVAGSDYLVLRGDHNNDDGGSPSIDDQGNPILDNNGNPLPIVDPTVDNPTSNLFISHFFKRGSGFAKNGNGQAQQFQFSHEADFTISPSSQIMSSRATGNNGSRAVTMGYRIRFVKPDGGTTINPMDQGSASTLCMKGNKANFSLDERFLVTHHNVEAEDNDPAVSGNVGNSSNIYLYDMQSRKSVRLTHMQPGQFALYPHFRNDGWIYFLVRDNNAQKHYIVASDAALQLAGGN